MRKFIAGLALALCLPCAVNASVFIKGTRALGAYVFNYNGTLDLTGMSLVGTEAGPGHSMTPMTGEFLSYTAPVDLYALSFLPVFGSGGELAADFKAGSDLALFDTDLLGLPAGYVSGEWISGSLWFSNWKPGPAGLYAGSFTTYLPSGDWIRMTIPVPLPAAGWLAVAGIGVLAGLRRRRCA